MRLLYENILVSELEDDLLMSNGVVTSYDSDSPYMFCEIKNISEQAMYDLYSSTLGTRIDSLDSALSPHTPLPNLILVHASGPLYGPKYKTSFSFKTK